MKKVKKYYFLWVFFGLLIYPLISFIINNEMTLNGVTNENVMEAPTVKGIFDGSFQTSLNEKWDTSFSGRGLLIKIRSQMLYSLFYTSPNANVVIGSDRQLFEPTYISKELGLDYKNEQAYYDDQLSKLQSLNQIVENSGKELYLFITPSKGYFNKEDIPWQYKFLERSVTETNNNYSDFIKNLKGTGLKYFIARDFIENNSSTNIDAPIYYQTGTHWSTSWGNETAIAFADFISDSGAWNIGELSLEEVSSSEPEWPNADLYLSLNLLCEPEIEFYNAKIIVTEEGDHPNVFMRGGSFMGQSLSGLIKSDVFNEDFYLENSYYFEDKFSKTGTISSYTAYDEIEIAERINQSDIIILEINEAAIDYMSFGFIDYLFENIHLYE
ncbi:MAG: hypothetical protein ACK5ML_07835 [Lachnospiraceae bacterium]